MKLSKEQVMVANGMQEHGTSVRQLAGQLGVTEGALPSLPMYVRHGAPKELE